MKNRILIFSYKFKLIMMLFLGIQATFSQNDSIVKPKSEFWQKVQFGGGMGLAFGNGSTNISLSPTGYYNISPRYMVGVGLTGSYVNQNEYGNNYNNGLGYKSTILGGSVIGIANVFNFLQFSAEVEELNISTKFDGALKNQNSWNTAFFLGGGYRNDNFTFGMRYNVLYNKSSLIYGQAWMPFLRVIF